MPEKCQYCGANQVPHALEWYQETLEVFCSPIRRVLIYNPVGAVFQRLVDNAIELFLKGLRKIHLIRYNTDPEKIRISRAKVLWEEAVSRNIEIKEMRLLDTPLDLYHVRLKNKEMIFTGLPRPKNYFNSALDWADDKYILKKRLVEAGLPVPKGGSAATYLGALKIFRSIPKPVIVKPRIGSRGRHTTTFIYNEEQLKRAFKIAKQLCYWVIVEQHINGPVWRGTVVDGKCVGVLGGDPPKVTGDGKHTIEQLIALANQNKNPHVKDIVIDQKMHWFLSRNQLGLQSVLPKDRQIDLTEKIGISYGGSSFEVYEQTHPDILKMFEDAAAVIGDPILGFDFICEDIGKSWKEQQCGIIECNGLPFINLHHDPLYGNPRNVAKHVWDMVEQRI